MDQGWLSVSDAAGMMSLSPRHVRSLLESGELRGQKMGRAWFVDPVDAQRRGAHQRKPGRPLSAPNAWRYLAALDAAHRARAAGGSPDRAHILEAPLAAAKPVDRSRLRLLLANLPDAAELSRLLRSRAVVRRMRVHPGALDRLLSDERVSMGAGRAVAARGGGIASGGQARVYVREADMTALSDRYRLADDVEGSVDVAVISAGVPEALLPEPGRLVSEAVAWLDLIDDPNSRARSAARDWVAALPASIVLADGRRNA